jgi:hypothetical protein
MACLASIKMSSRKTALPFRELMLLTYTRHVTQCHTRKRHSAIAHHAKVDVLTLARPLVAHQLEQLT